MYVLEINNISIGILKEVVNSSRKIPPGESPGGFSPGQLPPGEFPPDEFPPGEFSPSKFPPGVFPSGDFQPVNFALENYFPVKKWTGRQELGTHRNDQLLQLRFIFANGIFLTSFGVLIFANYPMQEVSSGFSFTKSLIKQIFVQLKSRFFFSLCQYFIK